MALRPPAGTGLSPKPALGIFVKSGQLRGEVEFLVTPGGPATTKIATDDPNQGEFFPVFFGGEKLRH